MGGWDRNWERVYQTQEWGKYPPEELVRFIAKNFYEVPNRGEVKILDLGCGIGACSWYLAREEFSAYGIDGSTTAIKKAEQRFSEDRLIGKFVVGDFVSIPYPNGFFDCVVDICSIQHNRPLFARKAVLEVYRVLKPSGMFFSMLASFWKLEGAVCRKRLRSLIQIKRGKRIV
jgi:ubiquinone/menaquinone biosynthesis C-methylase UbiE